jgi:hypothetical protein
MEKIIKNTWWHVQKHGPWLDFGLANPAASHFSLMLQPKRRFPQSLPCMHRIGIKVSPYG